MKPNFENLQKLLDYMIKTYGDAEMDEGFDMENYAYRKVNDHLISPDSIAAPECGTSCCLAGHGAYIFNVRNRAVNWDHFCWLAYGIKDPSPYWSFLFSSNWPSNIKMALDRLRFFIEHRGAPANFEVGRMQSIHHKWEPKND